jgi:Ca2+-binding EF-hand superfamily protein
MSFGLLKFGEKCDRHRPPAPRGVDNRTVVFKAERHPHPQTASTSAQRPQSAPSAHTQETSITRSAGVPAPTKVEQQVSSRVSTPMPLVQQPQQATTKALDPARTRKSSAPHVEPVFMFEQPSAEEIDRTFRRVDFNGNGMLSLAELDKAVVELWPTFNHKPAIMRAYKACDVDKSGFVSKREFGLFLLFLRVFDATWKVFAQIDGNGDRRLTLSEFQQGAPVLASLGLNASREELECIFRKIDENNGGYVLFDEFCHYFASDLVNRERGKFRLSQPAKAVAKKEPPPPKFELPPAAMTQQLFQRLDFNGNGMLSLAELDKAVVELWPKFNNKPAILRAYKACDANGSGFISKKEFRSFLQYLVVYQALWERFMAIDTNGDRKLTLAEFLKGKPNLGLLAVKSDDDCTKAFRSIDKNGGGVVLFDEFCSYFAAQAMRDFRESRSADPAEVCCMGLPVVCCFCGHRFSHENLPKHLKDCRDKLLHSVDLLPSFLRIGVPDIPVIPNKPQELEEFNARMTSVSSQLASLTCPECSKELSIAAMRPHWQTHKLSTAREKELRKQAGRVKVGIPAAPTLKETPPLPRMVEVLVGKCKAGELAVLRRSIDSEFGGVATITRKEWESVLLRCRLEKWIPELSLGAVFQSGPVAVSELRGMLLEATKPTPSATPPFEPAAEVVKPRSITVLARMSSGEVERISIENSSGNMKLDKYSICRRLHMMGFDDVQNVELL